MLTLKHINKSYGNRTILSDISLSIRKGEIVSILGPSGCGKTTLLNLILGLTQATSGKIMFDGEDLTNVPMQKRGFNIVFQDFALPELERPRQYRLRSSQQPFRIHSRGSQ